MFSKQIKMPVEKISREAGASIMDTYLRSSASRSHVCRFMLLYLIHQASGTMSRAELNNAFLMAPSLDESLHQKTKARVGKQIETALATGYIKRVPDAISPAYKLTPRGAVMVINGIKSRAAMLTCDPRLNCSEVMTLVCEEESSSHTSSDPNGCEECEPEPKPKTTDSAVHHLSLVLNAWSTTSASTT